MVSTCPKEIRGRKTMRRSRFGCRNCKLRKLKCDEGKPQCERCASFKLICNFVSPSIGDLQPAADDSARPVVVRQKPLLRPPVSTAVWTADASASYQLSTTSQESITRYLSQNLISPEDMNLREVNRKLFVLAFNHPFLMHASLAVAFAYDRHLNSSPGSRPTLEEFYHCSRSLALFNRRLREPIGRKDKDPIWGTAAALAVLTYSSPNASTPEESWPLKASDPSDLEWFGMSKGKMSLWSIVNPLRPDSIFRILASTLAHMLSPLPEEGIDGIPSALATLCHLAPSSTAATNPYFNAAHAVSHIHGLPDTQISITEAEQFLRGLDDSFKLLLQEKDPIALLLLYLWYRKAGRRLWFVETRARIECPSICSYLRLYHKENSAVHAFLPGGSLADRWTELDIESLESKSHLGNLLKK